MFLFMPLGAWPNKQIVTDQQQLNSVHLEPGMILMVTLATGKAVGLSENIVSQNMIQFHPDPE